MRLPTLTLLALSLLAVACAASHAAPPRLPDHGPSAARAPAPPRSPMYGLPALAVAAGGYAKAVCSGVFIAGADAEQAGRDATFVASAADRATFDVGVDRAAQTVTVHAPGGVARVARYYGELGCVALAPGATDVSFELPTISAPGRDLRAEWPAGEATSPGALPGDVDATALDRALKLAFSDPVTQTEAVVVVHRGHIIAERYAAGVGPDTPIDASAMGKSLLATLVGRLVQDGALRVDDPAPIAAWRRDGDARSNIRIIDLMRMSSGLACSFPSPCNPR